MWNTTKLGGAAGAHWTVDYHMLEYHKTTSFHSTYFVNPRTPQTRKSLCLEKGGFETALIFTIVILGVPEGPLSVQRPPAAVMFGLGICPAPLRSL